MTRPARAIFDRGAIERVSGSIVDPLADPQPRRLHCLHGARTTR